MTEDKREITPADDPYEFEWPDDAAEQRAAERAKAAQKADVKPASLMLSATVIGIGTVLLFMLPVTIVAGAINVWIAMAAPVVIGGLFALIPAILIHRITASWRKGLPELAFVLGGFLVGWGWSWFIITAFDGPSAFRVRAAVFMGTAVAAAFLAARTWAEPFRRFPKQVYIGAAIIVFLTVASIINFILFNIGG